MICYTPYCNKQTKKNAKHCGTCAKALWRLANPVKYIMQQVKGRAKRDGIPFNLEFESFNEWCTKNNFVAERGRSRMDASLDRKIHNDPRGYHIDNIQKLSNAANSAKRIREQGNPNPFKVPNAPCPF